MTYHEVIEDIIRYVLEKDDNYYRQLNSGNAYDKVIRNYHQFNYKGERVYRSILKGPKFYRYSSKAWRNRKNRNKLNYEHLVPVKLIKVWLRDCDGSRSEIRRILNETEIVVVTRDEAVKMDSFHRVDLPSDGRNRLDVAGIEMSKQTKGNSLFSEPE